MTGSVNIPHVTLHVDIRTGVFAPCFCSDAFCAESLREDSAMSTLFPNGTVVLILFESGVDVICRAPQ